jgi:Flp pilus assembly protein TadD
MREFEQKMSGWKTNEWLVFSVGVVVVLACSSYTIKKLFDALEVDPRAMNRWELWKSGFDMVMSQPLLGFGPGTFPDVFPAYQPAAFWNAFVPAAHNEYLQTTIECGLPALLLTLLFLWYILRETGSRVLKTPTFKEAPKEDLLAEYTFYLVLLEAVHNTVDFTFHEWCHRLVILGFVTYALTRKRAMGDVEVSLDLSRRAYLAGAALLALFVLWTLGLGGYKDYRAKLYNFSATLAYQQQDLDSAEDFSRKSLGLRGDFMESWDLLGAISDVRGERSPKPGEKRKFLGAAEEYYEKASQMSPYSLTPVENRVRLMMVQGRLEDALDLQNELVEKAPAYPPAYIEQGGLLLRLGRAQDAIASAQKAVDLDYYYIPGQLLKANAMEALGKRKDAVQVYKTIEDILKQVNNPEYAQKMAEINAHIRKLEGQP